MKISILVFLSSLMILVSSVLYAGCGDCGKSNSCQVGLSCCPYDNVCECTDPGVGHNPCMGVCEYCEAFGNVGRR